MSKKKNLNPKIALSKRKQAAHTRYLSPLSEKPLLPKEKRIEKIADHFESIMQLLGLDIDDDSLSKTPMRVAKMYVNEVFSGLDPSTFPEIRLIDEHCTSDIGHQSLVLTKAHFISFCEHHFVPMIGHAYVGYNPNGKVIGLSKIHRIVRYFAARPQLQERLTSQIADSLSIILETEDVAVSVQAQHFCVLSRGVRDENGITSTNYFSGAFKTDPSKRDEFFKSIEQFSKQSLIPD